MKECLDEGTLQSYFDGELHGAAAEQAASHLAACELCAASAREIQNEMSLLTTALQPEFTVSVPTAALRARIEVAVAELQTDRAYVPQANRSRIRFRDLLGWFPQRALGYAVLSIIILTAAVFGVVYWNRRASTPAVESVKNQPPSETASPKSLTGVVPRVKPDPSPVETVAGVPKRVQPSRAIQQTVNTPRLLPGEREYVRTIAKLDATIKSGVQPMRPGLQVEYQHNLALLDQAIAATRLAAQKNPRDSDAAQFLLSAYQSKVDLMTQVADARLFNSQGK
jgi:anti-sigma factor RsiW